MKTIIFKTLKLGLLLILFPLFLTAQPLNIEYTKGRGKNAIDFRIGPKKANQVPLATKWLRSKSDPNATCVNDYFQTSGTVQSWKVFPGDQGAAVRDILPGEVYNLDRYDGAFFPRIDQYPRYPILITLNSVFQGNRLNALVRNPRRSGTIRAQGLKPIFDQLNPDLRGSEIMITSNFERIYNERQFEVIFGGVIPYGIGKLRTDISKSGSGGIKQYTYLLEVEERYFSLSQEARNSSEDHLFSDLPEKVSYDKWAYVSKVNYGRRISVIVESNYRLDQFSSNSETSFNLWKVEAEAQSDHEGSEKQASFQYTIYLHGGSATDNKIKLVSQRGNIKKLLKSLERIVNSGNLNIEDAKPISFEMRRVGGAKPLVVSTYSPTQSKEERCNATLQIYLKNIKAKKVKDNTGQKNIELYGNYSVKAYNDQNQRFYEDGYEPHYQIILGQKQLINTPGKTTFASRDRFISMRENALKTFNKTDAKSGGKSFTLPNNGLNGYFRFQVNAKDNDKGGSKDDVFEGSSNKIYFKDLTKAENRIIQVEVTGKRDNLYLFTFEVVIK